MTGKSAERMTQNQSGNQVLVIHEHCQPSHVLSTGLVFAIEFLAEASFKCMQTPSLLCQDTVVIRETMWICRSKFDNDPRIGKKVRLTQQYKQEPGDQAHDE